MRRSDERAREFFQALLTQAIQHVRSAARLEKKDEKGTPVRSHLEEKARRGDATARAALEVPACPEEVEYLVEWACELCGRDGSGATTLNLLSNREMRAWAEMRERRLEPYEADALMLLNSAQLYPDEGEFVEGAAEGGTVHQPHVPQWRQRPEGVEPQFVIEDD